MHIVDWAIVVAYCVLALGIGALLARRAGRSMSDFLLSGRSLPWWLAGTSMVATTFAADTPLAVTGLTAKHGLAGNWLWWAFALGGMFTVFVYSRLWRRAEVMTDVELVELRYGGRPAAFLRGFRALYVALLVNSIICGWVTVAMLKVLKYTVFADSDAADGGSDWLIIVACLAVVGIYSTLSGLWGVTITDFLQFCIAMGGCIMLAVLAVRHVGGIEAMQARVAENFEGGNQAFRYLPQFFAENPWMPLNVFLIMLFVQWWATWYPGAEPGGGGYVVQRMASCKNEKHSLFATLWFQIAHYCVRPWPWLLVAFAAMAMYPNLRTLEDPGVGFPMVIRDLAPAGLRGLILVAFFAAFMSTISTQMNWGASYLVSDFYKRFLRPGKNERHYTRISRLASVLILACGGFAAWLMQARGLSVEDAWKFLMALGAGTGAVFMLRWFWWRINAWSEITAMVASLVFFIVVSRYFERAEHTMAIVAGLTVWSWLLVTLVTRPESRETLTRFYRKVRPGGPGWAPVAAEAPEVVPDRHLGLSIAAALAAAGLIYLTIPGVGMVIFGRYAEAAACFGGAAVCAVIVFLLMKKIGWGERERDRAQPPRAGVQEDT